MRLTAAISTIIFCFALWSFPTAIMATERPLTQRDLMTNLVDTLGYSFGLPDTPQDSDYSELLAGGRSFRFEAETFRNPEDLVAVNSFSSFGEFSGPGWVSAISTPTRMRMNFLLPQSGTYRLFVAVRLAGHTLMLEGQSWQIDDNFPQFTRVDLGEITLNAGMKEMAIAMPANGSIDYIELIAPPRAAIMPLSEWNPDAPLTYAELAVTVLRALDLQNVLPLQGESILLEAEEITQHKSLRTDQRHLGEPHGGYWLRSGAVGGSVSLRFAVDRSAVYTLNLIAAGAKRLTGTLNTRDSWQADFPPYLQEKSIGTWYLPVGQHQLDIELPPRGGVDLLTLVKRRSTAEEYLILAGLPADASVTAQNVNRLLTLLNRLHSRD
ncbi:MAG: hypothetical protein Q7U44_00430 [Desulfuromonadales bacterium]|nr:hypothetical protein [Desulfuromonadales bacterium]